MNRKMKKGAISLLALGVALWKPTSASALFTVQGSPVVSKAGVTFTGAGTVSMTAAIQTIAGAADTQINWPGLTLPAGWARSGDVLAMNATLTAANGGIQIYTDNTNAAAARNSPAIRPRPILQDWWTAPTRRFVCRWLGALNRTQAPRPTWRLRPPSRTTSPRIRMLRSGFTWRINKQRLPTAAAL